MKNKEWYQEEREFIDDTDFMLERFKENKRKQTFVNLLSSPWLLVAYIPVAFILNHYQIDQGIIFLGGSILLMIHAFTRAFRAEII